MLLFICMLSLWNSADTSARRNIRISHVHNYTTTSNTWTEWLPDNADWYWWRWLRDTYVELRSCNCVATSRQCAW